MSQISNLENSKNIQFEKFQEFPIIKILKTENLEFSLEFLLSPPFSFSNANSSLILLMQGAE